MAIQTLKDTGTTNQITSSMDGAVYSSAVGDCICGGLGDEFFLNYSPSSLTVSFNAGSQCIIGGNFFKVKSVESVELTASSTIYLCARIDTSRASGQTGQILPLTQAQMTKGNINGSDTTRDLLLYIVTTNASGVTGIVDKRFVKGIGSGITDITLGTSWTLDSNTNLYYQDVSFTGMTANDKVNIEPVYTNKTLAQIEAIEDIISAIKYYDTMSGKIRFYASEETTTSVDLLVVGV